MVSCGEFDYSGLTWLDSKQTQPTETEVNSKISELDNAEPMRLLRIEREYARIARDRLESIF